MDIKTAMQVRAPNHLAFTPGSLEQPKMLTAIFRAGSFPSPQRRNISWIRILRISSSQEKEGKDKKPYDEI